MSDEWQDYYTRGEQSELSKLVEKCNAEWDQSTEPPKRIPNDNLHVLTSAACMINSMEAGNSTDEAAWKAGDEAYRSTRVGRSDTKLVREESGAQTTNGVRALSTERAMTKTRSWTEKMLATYVRSIACGAKTGHVVAQKPGYRPGHLVTFFCHQNGSHPAVTAKVRSIERHKSYLDVVRKNQGTLAPYAQQRPNVAYMQEDDSLEKEYTEYVWLMTERKVGKARKSLMTTAEFTKHRPWLVQFDLVEARQVKASTPKTNEQHTNNRKKRKL